MVQGNPEQPRCGFSSKVVNALRRTGLPFGTFDILQDEAVRQGLKVGLFNEIRSYCKIASGALYP